MTVTTTRPSDILEWASEDLIEPISGLDNKTEPTTELKLSGLLDNENLTRQHYNYLLDLISDWVNYFDAIHGVNTVYISSVDSNPSSLLGGTWIEAGDIVTTGTGTDTFFVFRRTV